jgi:hypothetical protein
VKKCRNSLLEIRQNEWKKILGGDGDPLTRKGTAQGKQFVKQPKAIAAKTAQYRRAKTGGKIAKRKKYGKAPHNRIY